MTRRG
jgi:hypothetical protein